jgi:hypothetical protein
MFVLSERVTRRRRAAGASMPAWSTSWRTENPTRSTG